MNKNSLSFQENIQESSETLFLYHKRNVSQSLHKVIRELRSNSRIYRVIGLDVEREIRKLKRKIR